MDVVGTTVHLNFKVVLCFENIILLTLSLPFPLSLPVCDG